jgi:hypothetical protein
MLYGSPETTRLLPRETAEPEDVRRAYRGLVGMGWSVEQAASMAAHLAGLESSRKGWTMAEVEGLMFMRSLVQDGRLEP